MEALQYLIPGGGETWKLSGKSACIAYIAEMEGRTCWPRLYLISDRYGDGNVGGSSMDGNKTAIGRDLGKHPPFFYSNLKR